MPMQTSKSRLMAKYGPKFDAAVRQHAADETDYGFVQLPPGITNGIAKVVKCYFDQYKSGPNQGEYYFRAQAVVVTPESVDTPQGAVKVAGLHTSIMEAVCDTTTQAGKVTTQADHVASILNEMRKIAGDDFTAGKGGADLEDLAAAIQEAGPYVKFSTSPRMDMKDKKTVVGVWENWHGGKGLEDYVPDEAPGGGFADATGGGPTEATPSANGAAGGGGNETFSEFDDLASLVERATAGDADAVAKIKEMAVANGLTEEAIDEAASWEDAAALVTEATAGGGTEPAAEEPAAEPEPEEFQPTKGDVYKYAPLDPKTKKPLRDPKTKKDKTIEVEVLTVNEKGKTVTAKSLDDGKYVGTPDPKNKNKIVPTAIPWDSLIVA